MSKRLYKYTPCRVRSCPNSACGLLDYGCIHHCGAQNSYLRAWNEQAQLGRCGDGFSVAAHLHPGALLDVNGLDVRQQHFCAQLFLQEAATDKKGGNFLLVHMIRLHNGLCNGFAIDSAMGETLTRCYDARQRFVAISMHNESLDDVLLMCYDFDGKSVTVVPQWDEKLRSALERTAERRAKLRLKADRRYAAGIGMAHFWNARGEPRRRRCRYAPYAPPPSPAQRRGCMQSAMALLGY